MELAIEIIKQVILLGGLALGGGIIASGFTEVLKYEVFRIPAERYPKVTAAVISFALSAVAVVSLNAIVFDTWVSWVIVGGATLFSAVKSYDWILKGLYEKFRSKDS